MAPLNKPDYVSLVLCHYSQRDSVSKKTDIRKQFLRECIDSIEKNTDYPTEVVVVDNGGRDDDSSFLVDKVRSGLINTYIRNKDNMFYGWAWNQGVKLATSNFIVLVTNDVVLEKNWLSESLRPLTEIDDKIVVAITGSKEKYNVPMNNGYYSNKWAGSDCLLLTKDIYYEIGEYTTHHLGGSQWFQKLHKAGYTVVIPKTPRAHSLGAKKGFAMRRNWEIKEHLLNGGVADFTYKYNKREKLVR